MDINEITIGQAKQIAAFVDATSGPCEAAAKSAEIVPVVVCTDKRGVVFGYCANVHARPITLTSARMCLYWSADVGGVFGLSDNGPTKGCKISATAPSLSLEGVTAVFEVASRAEDAWASAPVQGR